MIGSGGQVGNLVFLGSFFRSALALLLSAVILVILFLFITHRQFANHPDQHPGEQIEALIIPGDDLSTILGSTEADGRALTINKLQKIPDDHRAILSRPVQFNAQNYPFLRYEIYHSPGGTHTYLFWRTTEHPESIYRTPLSSNSRSATTIDLTGVEHWQGQVVEVGIDVYGALGGAPLRVSSMAFRPYSGLDALDAVWSQWTRFAGWTQSSINHLADRTEPAIASRTVAAAAVSGCALLLLLILCRITRKLDRQSLVLAVAIPWLALDLSWQRQLAAQLEETERSFGKKPQHQKYIAAQDSALYLYARHLRDEVLPVPGERIFLLHDSKGHNFERLRLAHHLLPHNIYNFGSYPQKNAMRRGDYILVLGEIPRLEFIPEKNILRWNWKHRLKVQRIDHHELGDVYKVMKLQRAADSTQGPPAASAMQADV